MNCPFYAMFDTVLHGFHLKKFILSFIHVTIFTSSNIYTTNKGPVLDTQLSNSFAGFSIKLIKIHQVVSLYSYESINRMILLWLRPFLSAYFGRPITLHKISLDFTPYNRSPSCIALYRRLPDVVQNCKDYTWTSNDVKNFIIGNLSYEQLPWLQMA